MRTSSLKHIAVLLFVIVMTNLCVWSFSTDRLAHDLEHNSTLQMSAVHAHVDVAVVDLDEQNENSNDSEQAAGLVAHQALHAIDHLQFFPDTAPGRMFITPMANLTSLHFTVHALPWPVRASLFRPPRSVSA